MAEVLVERGWWLPQAVLGHLSPCHLGGAMRQEGTLWKGTQSGLVLGRVPKHFPHSPVVSKAPLSPNTSGNSSPGSKLSWCQEQSLRKAGTH